MIDDIGVGDIGENGDIYGIREKKAVEIIDDFIQRTECQGLTIECKVNI